MTSIVRPELYGTYGHDRVIVQELDLIDARFELVLRKYRFACRWYSAIGLRLRGISLAVHVDEAKAIKEQQP